MGRNKLEEDKKERKKKYETVGIRREEKKRVIGKKWALPGIEPMPGLKV